MSTYRLKRKPPGTGVVAGIFGLLLAATLFAGLAASGGCKTVPDEQRLATRIERVTERATPIILIAHPEWREGFEIAQIALEEISRDETADFDDVIAIFDRLPVEELKTDEAMLIAEGGLLLIDLTLGGQAIDLEEFSTARVVAAAAARGLKKGLER